jgi:hypothetical protein
VGYLVSRDGGSGYYDYQRLLAALQLRWQDRGWQVAGQVRLRAFHYPRQLVDGEARERTAPTVELKVERSLARHWRLYAEVLREWSFSNDPPDDYRAWSASGGLRFSF